MSLNGDRGRLVAAMLAPGGDGARQMYLNDAEFHAQVDALADVWVLMVPQLVEASRERKRAMEVQIDLLMHGTVHASPKGADAITPCCGRLVFDLSPFDRMSNDDAAVTCPGARSSTGEPASGPAGRRA